MRSWNRYPQFYILGILVSAQAAFGGPSEYRVTDATGIETIFKKTPKRVVPLQPSLAELADRIGVGASEIVGVSAYTDFPKALKSKPQVGSYVKPNLESIVALHPDLVLASRDGTPKELVLRLRKLGVPVVTVQTETIAGLREAYPILGAALGKSESAERALSDFDQEIEKIRERAKSRKSLRVLLQVGEDPLVVAAGKTFLNEGLKILGAINIYPDSKKTYPRVSVEDVLKKNPEAIVLVGMGEDIRQFERAEKRWGSFPDLAATRNKRVVLLRSDELVRPGPRFPVGLEKLERAIFKKVEGPK
jgi:iron complex transport system substrate-binding protein